MVVAVPVTRMVGIFEAGSCLETQISTGTISVDMSVSTVDREALEELGPRNRGIMSADAQSLTPRVPTHPSLVAQADQDLARTAATVAGGK